jgi:4-amino-4-deoxy-L-arabinose transferase-like glycosyltransferase
LKLETLEYPMASASAVLGFGTGWWVAWVLYAITSVLVRDLLPIDETRYVTVAWEMWQRGDWLVPYLLGEPYSHKPPLLFWSVLAGWSVFGVVDWWPRLLPLLIGLANLLALRRLALILWPSEPAVARVASEVLLGSTLWLVYSSLFMFDLLLSLCVLLSLGELADWERRGPQRASGLRLGLWMGLGVLAKGPVVLVYVLPAGVLMPFLGLRQSQWGVWYLRLLVALLTALLVAAAWALPAASAGGEAYGRLILWDQFAGRVSQSFAHAQPWWWYLPLLPLLAWPWSLWPRAWLTGKSSLATAGLPLLVLLLSLLLLSLISGKQLHYLLPLVPVGALLIARRLARGEPDVSGVGQAWWVGLGTLLVFALIIALREGAVPGLPWWVRDIPLLLLCLGLLLGGMPVWGRRRLMLVRVRQVAWVGFATALLLQLAVVSQGSRDYPLREVAARLQAAEQGGQGSLYLGGYAGEFNFVGRLRQGPETAYTQSELATWVAAHPEGLVLRMFRGDGPADVPPPVYVQPYRGKRLGLWSATDIAREPRLAAWLAP